WSTRRFLLWEKPESVGRQAQQGPLHAAKPEGLGAILPFPFLFPSQLPVIAKCAFLCLPTPNPQPLTPSMCLPHVNHCRENLVPRLFVQHRLIGEHAAV